MSNKAGTKYRNVYERKDYSGVKNNRRITCGLCGVKHYELRYHWSLKVIRERKFEFGGGIVWSEPALPFVKKSVLEGTAVTIYGKASFKKTGHGNNSQRHLIIPEWKLDTVRKTWSFAMGIEHYMRDQEISESIPPAYTRYIGAVILRKLTEQTK